MSRVADNLESLRYALPEGALGVGVLAILVWDLIAPKGSSRGRVAGAIGVALVALAASASFAVKSLASHVDTAPSALFGGQLALDRYGDTFRLLFPAITALVLVTAIPTREAQRAPREGGSGSEFVMLLLVICLGMDLMATSRSLLMIYLAIEIVSVISFVLAGFRLGSDAEERKSGEAALKYVVFGGVSSGVMLYGMSWIYGLTRSLDLIEIAERTSELTLSSGGHHLPNAIVLGAACILAGFAYKISAVPFHMWAPDVYEGAPTIVTAFLSIGPKAAGFAVLVRFFRDALNAHAASAASPGTPWPIVGGLLAAATMTLGNLSALAQTNMKRMLAYSSIAQAGYMLLAFAVFNDEGIAAIVFYIVAYCAMNLGAFLVVMAVADAQNGDESIDAFRGLGTRAPAMAAAMTIFLFSLVGLPPFAGFVGKVYIFAALLRAGGAYEAWYVLLAAVGVVNTVVSLFYYARVLRAMYLDDAASAIVDDSLTVNRAYAWVTAALVVPTIGLGVYWGPVYDFVVRSLGTAAP